MEWVAEGKNIKPRVPSNTHKMAPKVKNRLSSKFTLRFLNTSESKAWVRNCLIGGFLIPMTPMPSSDHCTGKFKPKKG
jgi:hypothetical protein